MRTRLGFLLGGALICVAVLAAFSGMGLTSGSSGEDRGDPDNGGAVARAGGGVAEARAGDVVARAGNSEQGTGETRTGGAVQDPEGRRGEEIRDSRAVLVVGGKPGTEFSGTCTVGDEERELKGKVPERYTFDLKDDHGLKCRLVNESGGRMRITFAAANHRTDQQMNTRGAEVKFSYSGSGISSSTSSSSSSSVVSQSSSSSVSSQSSSVVQSSD